MERVIGCDVVVFRATADGDHALQRVYRDVDIRIGGIRLSCRYGACHYVLQARYILMEIVRYPQGRDSHSLG